jgi:DEAD/DEAH box helicase domain-containing protein
MCDQRDIGLSVNAGDDLADLAPAGGDTPRIFLYDAYPGGIGFSAPLFGMHPELLERTRALIAGCECENGCPTCVGPVGETGPLAKTVALRLLQHLVPMSGPQLVGEAGRPEASGAAAPPDGRPAPPDDVPF